LPKTVIAASVDMQVIEEVDKRRGDIPRSRVVEKALRLWLREEDAEKTGDSTKGYRNPINRFFRA